MNDVIIIYHETSEDIKIYEGKLSDKELELGKQAHTCYVNSVCEEQEPVAYKALDTFYNNIFTPNVESGYMTEVKSPKEVKGTIILIGFAT